VEEVDFFSIDTSLELREAIKPCFAASPVVEVNPMPTEVLQIFERHTLAPPYLGLTIWPASRTQSSFKILEIRVWY
jgi:hypothetical protein